MGEMALVSGSLRFRDDTYAVYRYLARTVLAHAVEEQPDDLADLGATFLTRYETKLGPLTVVTTEEANLEPGRAITWRHVDGPLTGSVETFCINKGGRGETSVHYEGEIQARNRLLRGPLERLFVAPVTRMVSMKSLRDAKKALEGDGWSEGGGIMLP